MEDNSPWVSLVSTLLISRGTDNFAPNCLSKDVCMNSQRRQKIVYFFEARLNLFTVQYNKDNIPLQNKSRLLMVHYKIFKFPKLEVP